MRIIAKAGLCAIVLLLTVGGAFSQNNATQVVFSDTGGTMNLTGNSKVPSTLDNPNPSTPFGFWIWCNASAPSGSHSTYTGACNGSMYFYNLQTQAQSIVGFVTKDSSGTYTMNVFQGTFADFLHNKLNPSFICTLTNTTPDANGPGNTVQVNCTFANSLGGGMGTSTDTGSLVHITGPSN